jgi:NAD(P)-dependent dehydrogenase (short-subunit alcohol dehydrogenase family)
MADSLLGLGGKTVLVLGAGPGMGAACADVASRAGARVAAVDFAAERAAETAAAITGRGGEAVSYVANVLDDDQLRGVIGQVDQDFGGIDGVISVVGGSTWLPSLELDTTDFDHDYRLNLRYFFVAAQAVARAAVARERGVAITAITSIHGVRSAPLHIGYGAAKAGLINLVKSLAVEWADYGIRLNAVAPGVTFKDLRPRGTREEEAALVAGVPMARRADQVDIANAAVFLLSDMATMITGQTLAVDGGFLSAGPMDTSRFAPPAGQKRSAYRNLDPAG